MYSFLERGVKLKTENKEKFSIQKMREVFETYLGPVAIKPKESKLILPKLNKVK